MASSPLRSPVVVPSGNIELLEKDESVAYQSLSRDYLQARHIMLDWMWDYMEKEQMSATTQYLSTAIMDRFHASEMVPSTIFHLLGVCSVLIAAKLEEYEAPPLFELVDASSESISQEQIANAELTILKKIGWKTNYATPYHFLEMYLPFSLHSGDVITLNNQHQVVEQEFIFPYVRDHSSFFLSFAVREPEIVFRFLPSVVAAASVCAARSQLSITPACHPALIQQFGVDTAVLMQCLTRLLQLFKQNECYYKGPDDEYTDQNSPSEITDL